MTTTTTIPIQRMKNPALVIPEAMSAIQALIASTQKGGVDEKTLGLVHLRASQINGCSFCVDYGLPEELQRHVIMNRTFNIGVASLPRPDPPRLPRAPRIEA